jgi:hypothetical protein
MIRPTRGASRGALPAAGWFSIGAASFVPARGPLNWKGINRGLRHTTMPNQHREENDHEHPLFFGWRKSHI